MRPRGTGRLYQPKGCNVWWLQYYVDGRMVRQSSGTTHRKDANNILLTKTGQVREGNFIPPATAKLRVQDLAPALFQDYENKRQRGIEWARRCWNKHLESHFGLSRAASVSTDQLQDYIAKRRSEGAEHSTINRELSILKRIFTLAARSKKVQRLPVFPERLAEPPARRGFIDDEQYASLLQQLREPALKAMLCIGYHLGWRLGELKNLRVRQADFKNLLLTLDEGTTKNGDARTGPMTWEMRLLLEPLAANKKPDDFLFTWPDGSPVRDFRATWYNACVPAGLGTLDDNDKYSGLIFHDLRRSAVRNMVRSGISEKVAMTITGHKTRDVFERYNITNGKDLDDVRKVTEKSKVRGIEHKSSTTPLKTAVGA